MTWKTCKIHGPDKPNVWGCPECLRELREQNKRLMEPLMALDGFQRRYESATHEPGGMPGNENYRKQLIEIVQAARAALKPNASLSGLPLGKD